jgi:hypothetical protein
VDDIVSFKAVRMISDANDTKIKTMSEKTFKAGIARILKEDGEFKDWGGETNDLSTTRLRVTPSKRIAVAFAFKGPGTSGKLTPGKMGKNGDQIQRLFQSPVEVFLVQYWAQVADSVREQMAAFARIKAIATGKKIQYGVIDGQDTARIVAAYPSAFKVKKRGTR